MRACCTSWSPAARRTLVGTALLIFVFRAMPNTGAGSTWWMIDELGFDEQFISVLSLIGSALTLLACSSSAASWPSAPSRISSAFSPSWGPSCRCPTSRCTTGCTIGRRRTPDGMVDARFIALINTALESPLGQIAMIPMLAWIANCAPERLKATYFAVMASFTNLALSLSQLLTKYVNQIFVVTREVRDPVTAARSGAGGLQPVGAVVHRCDCDRISGSDSGYSFRQIYPLQKRVGAAPPGLEVHGGAGSLQLHPNCPRRTRAGYLK